MPIQAPEQTEYEAGVVDRRTLDSLSRSAGRCFAIPGRLGRRRTRSSQCQPSRRGCQHRWARASKVRTIHVIDGDGTGQAVGVGALLRRSTRPASSTLDRILNTSVDASPEPSDETVKWLKARTGRLG